MESHQQHSDMGSSEPPLTSALEYTYTPTTPAADMDRGLLSREHGSSTHSDHHPNSASSLSGLPMPSEFTFPSYGSLPPLKAFEASFSAPEGQQRVMWSASADPSSHHYTPFLDRSLLDLGYQLGQLGPPSHPPELKFPYSSHMNRNDAPYKCLKIGCEKVQGFSYSGGLLRHEREVHKMHGDTKQPLFCPFTDCKRGAGTGFTRKENLAEHIRRVHRRTSMSPDLHGPDVVGDGEPSESSSRNITQSPVIKPSLSGKDKVRSISARPASEEAISDRRASGAGDFQFITSSTLEGLRGKQNMTMVRRKAMDSYLSRDMSYSYPSPLGSSVSGSVFTEQDWEDFRMDDEFNKPTTSLASASNYQNLLDGNPVPGVTYPNSSSTHLPSKRTSHKIAEQGRRNRITLALHEIQSLLPSPNVGTKQEWSQIEEGLPMMSASKAASLEKAVDYIKQLKEEAREKDILLKSKDEEILELKRALRTNKVSFAEHDTTILAKREELADPKNTLATASTTNQVIESEIQVSNRVVMAQVLQICFDIIALMIAHLERKKAIDVSKRHCNVLKRSLAQLKLWSDGHGAWDGRLDNRLAQSTHLRHLVFSVLNSMCRTLLNALRTQEMSTSRRDHAQLQQRMTELFAQSKGSLSIMEDVDASDSESDDDDRVADSNRPCKIAQMIEDIKTYTDCLIDLGTALKSPVEDSASVTIS